MSTHESESLSGQIARSEASNAGQQLAIRDRMQELRDLAADGPAKDLTGCVDAALMLANLLSDEESSADGEFSEHEQVLDVMSRLVGIVEETVQNSTVAPTPAPSNEALQDGEQRLIRDLLLGEILVQLGIITNDQADEGLRVQRDSGLRIGEALTQIGAVTIDKVEQAVLIQDELRNASGFSGDLLGALVPNHPLWGHPFLRRCRAKQLTKRDVRILAGQMYKFCCEFSRILAATYVRCQDEDARVTIADNLYDEMGCGDPLLTHPELFRRFTRALNISDEQLEDLRVEPETQSLIDTYLSIPERYGYLGSLGAICYGSENLVAALYSQLLSGIENGVSVPDTALAFFKAHVELDVEHANALIRIVNLRVKSVDDAREVVLAIKEALAARSRFFDGIERCAQQASKPDRRTTDSNL